MKYDKKFFAAAREGDVELINQALADGFPVDRFSKFRVGEELNSIPGRTALMWATIEGQPDVVAVLLAAGASPHAHEYVPHMEAFSEGNELRSCWAFAAEFDRWPFMEMFFEAADPPDAQHLVECTVHAATHGSQTVLRQLLDRGVDINAFSSEDSTPLMAAASAGQDEVVKMLLARGADFKLRDTGRFAGTALHRALLAMGTGAQVSRLVDGQWVTEAKGNPVECVRLLLDRGADANEARADGEMPIIMAAGEPRLVKMLLEAGANANVAGRTLGNTALHWAVVANTPASVELLLAANADPSAVNKYGETALDIARTRHMSDIADILTAAGGVEGMATASGRAAADAKEAGRLAEEERQEVAVAADESLRPDFSDALQSDEYKQAIRRLEALTGERHELSKTLSALAYCRLELTRAKELLSEARDEFAELGCTLFRCGVALRPGCEDQLGILPTVDPFEVIAAMETAGPNDNVFMSDIVFELQELYTAAPFRLARVRYDTIVIELDEPMSKTNARKWATRLKKICPDLVSQGFLTVKKLRDHLEKEKALSLWWD